MQTALAAAEQSAAAEAALVVARRDAEASASESEARAGELLAMHAQARPVSLSPTLPPDACIIPAYKVTCLHKDASKSG